MTEPDWDDEPATGESLTFTKLRAIDSLANFEPLGWQLGGITHLTARGRELLSEQGCEACRIG